MGVLEFTCISLGKAFLLRAKDHSVARTYTPNVDIYSIVSID